MAGAWYLREKVGFGLIQFVLGPFLVALSISSDTDTNASKRQTRRCQMVIEYTHHLKKDNCALFPVFNAVITLHPKESTTIERRQAHSKSLAQLPRRCEMPSRCDRILASTLEACPA